MTKENFFFMGNYTKNCMLKANTIYFGNKDLRKVLEENKIKGFYLK
ncbi:MAG: hypothetical protein QW051_01590 [Candidatus Aenigmatarchaeota archaeon]